MSDHSIFTKRQNPNLKLSTDSEETPLNQQGKFSGFINTLKGYSPFAGEEEQKIDENLPFFQRWKLKIKNGLEVEKSYKLFFLVLAVGLGLIFLSFLFLPILAVAPSKFVSLFSLGALITLSSFIFVHGTWGFLEMLFSKNRLPFTLLFIFSIFLGLYFTFFNKSYYIISLICAVIQMITLAIYLLSFIPGGSVGINFITSMLMAPVKSLWGKVSGGN